MDIKEETKNQIEEKIKKTITEFLDFKKEIVDTQLRINNLGEEDLDDVKKGFDHIKNKYHHDNYFKYVELHSRCNDFHNTINNKDKMTESLNNDLHYWKQELKKVEE